MSAQRITLFLWLGLLPALALVARAEPLAIKEERLGAWHYLYPLEYGKHHRSLSQPTAIAVGKTRDTVAVLLPGSRKIAEFRGGTFTDLALPEEWLPLSLAVDREGRLAVLAQVDYKTMPPKDAWKRRFVLRLGEQGWEKAVAIPYDPVDRLEFDSAGRLWALGQAPQVGYLKDGRWETYAYSSDRKLEFLPTRIGKDDGDGVVLYSLPEPYPSANYSRMVGSLKYRAGRFTRQRTMAPAWTAAERAKIARFNDDADLQRAQGYVARPVELNDGRTARTVVRAGGAIVVSFGNEGLAWVKEAELKQAPPLPAGEWEAIDDVTAPPTLDPQGNLWLGRKRKLLKIGREKTEELAGDLPKTSADSTIDFDALGRPWITRWHASEAQAMAIAHEGKLLQYTSPEAAFRAESGRYQPGRIFPFAVKAPDGTLVIVSGFSDNCLVIDAKGTHTFDADQINPERVPQPGHGYNPFRNAEPWYDAEGRIYTEVKGRLVRYDNGRSRWVAGEGAKSVLPPLPEGERWPSLPIFQLRIPQAGKPAIIYDSLHFYEVGDADRRQLDFGVNPLAAYPFWTNFYQSPGSTTPLVDPTGALWVCRTRPYPEPPVWWLLKRTHDR